MHIEGRTPLVRRRPGVAVDKPAAVGRPGSADTLAVAELGTPRAAGKPAAVDTAEEAADIVGVAGEQAADIAEVAEEPVLDKPAVGEGLAAKLSGLSLPYRRIRKNGRCLPGGGRNRCKNVET